MKLIDLNALKYFYANLVEVLKSKADATVINAHIADKTNPHEVTKAQIGLANVEDKSSETIRSELTSDNVTDALTYTPLNAVGIQLNGKDVAKNADDKINILISADDVSAISYATTQTLTDAQKKIARENIGAGTGSNTSYTLRADTENENKYNFIEITIDEEGTETETVVGTFTIATDAKDITFDASDDYDNVKEALEAILAKPEPKTYKIIESEDESYAKSYKFVETDGTEVEGSAVINIPKDMVVQSGDVKTCEEDGKPVSTYVVGDKYLDLVLANSDDEHVYILLTDLIDTDGLVHEDRTIAGITLENDIAAIDLSEKIIPTFETREEFEAYEAEHGVFPVGTKIVITSEQGEGGASSADKVSYNNATSGLTATNVQGAVDEVVGIVGDINTVLEAVL